MTDGDPSVGSRDGHPVVEVHDVTRDFQRGAEVISALGPISIGVGQGEAVSLIGPSGFGKSTLLNVVAGLLSPTQGRGFVCGREVDGTPAEVGLMLQDAVLLEWRNGVENVLLPIEIAAGRRAARKPDTGRVTSSRSSVSWGSMRPIPTSCRDACSSEWRSAAS